MLRRLSQRKIGPIGGSVQLADPEVAEFKVSLGIVSGRVVLHQSTWQRMHRIFRKATLEEQIELAGGDAFVHVRAPDDAIIDLYLRISNFSGTAARIESMDAEWLGMGGRGLEIVASRLLTAGNVVGARTTATVPVRLPLLPASVRELGEAIRPAPNSFSTPDARLNLRGTLTMSQKATRAQLQFELNVPAPTLNVAKSVQDEWTRGRTV